MARIHIITEEQYNNPPGNFHSEYATEVRFITAEELYDVLNSASEPGSEFKNFVLVKARY